ncbi:MAG: GIY-YIG nuclease family protein [Candidatus Eisenbacteria bacterium]
MRFVYLIQSIPYPDRRYIGLTSDLRKRLQAHDRGCSPHTSRFRPWKLIAYIAFERDDKAANFERYLKSGSGRAFARRRIW